MNANVLRRLAVLALVVGTAACGASPLTPPVEDPALSLALSHPQVTLLRGEQTAVILLATLGPETTDVTAKATWSSSNEAVATVTGGQVRVVGLGTAVIAADYSGLRKTLLATGRRRTGAFGEVTVVNAAGESSINSVMLFWDDSFVHGMSSSGARKSMTVPFSRTMMDFDVGPGQHNVEVRFLGQASPPNTYDTGTPSRVVVYDRDTGQELVSVPFPAQSIVVPSQGKITWTITIPVISS